MFSKPLSILQRAEERAEFKLGPNNGDEDVNFEVELGVMIGKRIEAYSEVSVETLHDYIGGYFLLLDYTDKNFLMNDLKNQGTFFLAKCQDDFLVLSDFIEKDKIEDCHKVHLELKVNGEVRQSDLTGNMRFKIHEQLAFMASHGMNFIPGDLVMTGTPEGISNIKPGDSLHATMTDASRGTLLAEISQKVVR
jgi:acylpyruvate hydrolase